MHHADIVTAEKPRGCNFEVHGASEALLPPPHSDRALPSKGESAIDRLSTLQRSMHRPPSRPRPFHEERRDEAAEGGRGDEDCPKFMTHKLIYTACRFYDKSAHCSSCQVQSVSAQKVRSRPTLPRLGPRTSPLPILSHIHTYSLTHSFTHSVFLTVSLSVSLRVALLVDCVVRSRTFSILFNKG